VIEGIPVLLRADVAPTHGRALHTLKMAEFARQGHTIDPSMALDLPEPMKTQARRDIERGIDPVDAIIRRMLPLTNGLSYRALSPSEEIPIPRLPELGAGERLLDIGCSWGRWTIAAARAGFRPTGLDPLIGPLIAAKRLAARLGVEADYICGDARCLPFATSTFDRVHSYSTLQHFSDENCVQSAREIGRVLKPGGRSTVQMANRAGLRSAWHRMRRGFRAPQRFEVRYRSLSHLIAMFSEAVGPTDISIDCFFGLGLQASDIAFMRPAGRMAMHLSEGLKRAAHALPGLRTIADSVYCSSTKLPDA